MYDLLNDLLWRRLPWLTRQPEYADLMELWDDEEPGPHIAYGDVLVPVLVRMLSVPLPNNEGELREAFTLIEEIVASNDESISAVGVTTVLEGLHGFRGIREEVLRRLGPESRNFATRIEHDWGPGQSG